MNQPSIIPSVPRSAYRFVGGGAAAESRWPMHKTVLFVIWTSAALWTAIIVAARMAILSGG